MASDNITKPPDGAADEDDQPKGFFKLPSELRVKVYELLLLPPPAKRVECCGDPIIKICSPGGRLLASTCNPVSSSIRSYNCPTCIHRGADVHTAILATNKQVFKEASAVLYENTRLVLREGKFSSAKEILANSTFSSAAFKNIKHFQLSIQTADHYSSPMQRARIQAEIWPALTFYCSVGLRTVFQHLQHATLHFDVDATVCDSLDAKPFANLIDLGDIDYLIEVHIIRAWDGDDDWMEMTESRPEDPVSAMMLDEKAYQMRDDFVRDLSALFQAAGKQLKLRQT